MEFEGLKWLGEFGAMGVFAGMVLVMYRADRKASEHRSRQDREASEVRYAALAIQFREIVQDNTRVMTNLIDTLRRNGR